MKPETASNTERAFSAASFPCIILLNFHSPVGEGEHRFYCPEYSDQETEASESKGTDLKCHHPGYEPSAASLHWGEPSRDHTS